MRLTTYINDKNYDIHKEYRKTRDAARFPEISDSLMKLFGMQNNPIFCCIDGTNSPTVNSGEGLCLSLDVPESECHVMEYYTLNDYIYYYSNLNSPDRDNQLELIKERLLLKRPVSDYNMPQVAISKIEPQWVKYSGPGHDYIKNANIVKQELVRLLNECMAQMKDLGLKDFSKRSGSIVYTEATDKYPERLAILSDVGYFLFENETVYGLSNPVNLDTRTESFNVVVAYSKIATLSLLLQFQYLKDKYGEQEFLDKIAEYITNKYNNKQEDMKHTEGQ